MLHAPGHGEGEGETLMDTVAAPSDSSSYISIPVAEQVSTTKSNGNPKPSAAILPLESNPTPYFAISDQSNTSLPLDDGPLVLGVPPFSLAGKQEPRPSRRCSNSVLLVALLLLVLAVLIPVAVVLRSRHARHAEARRRFEIRAFKHRTGFHFQPDKNWMNGRIDPMFANSRA